MMEKRKILGISLLSLAAMCIGCQSPSSSSATVSLTNTVPGCYSNGDSGQKNPHCPSPSPSLRVSELSYGIPDYWTHFVIDSANNTYLPDLNQNGVIKTSASGAATRYFAGSSASVIAKDQSDNVYVFTGAASTSGGSPTPSTIAIQKISADGVVSTICSSSECQSAASLGFYGSGVVDTQGNLYFQIGSWSTAGNASGNDFIAKVTPSGAFSQFGSSGSAISDGSTTSAVFMNINSIAIDSSGAIYTLEADQAGQVIRKITNGTVSTIAQFGNEERSSMVLDSAGNFFYLKPIQVGVAGSQVMELTPGGAETPICGDAWTGSTVQVGLCGTTYIWDPSGFGMALDASGSIVFNQYIYNSNSSALFRISSF